jgi:hypothetical protein
MEPINVLALSCSTSSPRMSMKLVNDGQPLAKRRHRASSTFSSVRPVEVRTPPVIELLRDVGPCAGLNREEEILDDHEWQAQCIIGERQTPSGLEYEVSVEKTLWLPQCDA